MNFWPYFVFCMTLPQLLLDTFMVPTTYPDCMVQWPKCHAGCAPAAGKVLEHPGMRRKTDSKMVSITALNYVQRQEKMISIISSIWVCPEILKLHFAFGRWCEQTIGYGGTAPWKISTMMQLHKQLDASGNLQVAT